MLKSKTLKYVIIKPLLGREAAILFDERLVHSQTVSEDIVVVSAGFCSLKYDDRSDNALIIEVWGESTSTGLKSREIDKNLIYQSIIPGPYDYFMEPDDPLFDKIDNMIKKARRKEDETFG